MAAKNNSNEIKITRIYDAPVKLVWEAWTDPQKTAKWWGPRGFTLTSHSKDLRPGGIWHYTMHGPDGTDYPNKTLYHEVEKYSRLVYDHGGYDERKPLFRVTAVFTEIKGKTKLEMTMTLPTPEAAAATRAFIKQAGGNGTWDRLAEFLEKEDSGKEKFVINRSFEAPRATLYKMWTDPEYFSQWLAPSGFTMSFPQSEIRTGSEALYSMTSGTTTVDGKAKYLTTVDFNEEGPDETRATLTLEIAGEATPGEIENFRKAKGELSQRWSSSFDKLEELLLAQPG